MLNNNPLKPASPLAEKLLAGAVVCVPFQQAFTIDLGFPLKLSEILAIFAIFLFLLEGRKATHRATNGKTFAVLATIIAASTLWNIGQQVPVDTSPGYSKGFVFDLIQYAAYGFMVLLVGWMMATRLGFERIGECVGIAVRLALVYCLVQMILYLAGSHVVLEVINGANQSGRSYGFPLTRNGPFLEGNYLGFFAGAALFISARRKDGIGVIASLLCLFYSQSTTGMVAAAAGLLALLAFRPTGRVVTAVSSIAAAALALATFIPQGKEFIDLQLGKLGLIDQEGAVAAIGYSRRSRSLNADTGFTMGFEHPIFGVGPGRYGVWYDTYVDREGLPDRLFSNDNRAIANNAYAQISAELGFAALAAVIFLLLFLFIAIWRKSPESLPLVVFVAVGLNATPAWTVLPIWVMIAYLISVAAAPAQPKPAAVPRKTPHARAIPLAGVGPRRSYIVARNR